LYAKLLQRLEYNILFSKKSIVSQNKVEFFFKHEIIILYIYFSSMKLLFIYILLIVGSLKNLYDSLWAAVLLHSVPRVKESFRVAFNTVTLSN